jgi:dTDP-4-dehydrorhamnose reductase
MRVLVLGGSGQVGTELLALPRPSSVDVVAPSRSVLNLEDQKAITKRIAEENWDVVINASGYTNVDAAESDEAHAFKINAQAVAQLADETGKREIPVIHISTDYVFDGTKDEPYLEIDDPSPINTYGRSKLAGEQALRSTNPRHIILRTSWVYSPYGKNFVKTILRLAQSQVRLNIVADQLGCPTAAYDIARISLELALTCARQPRHVSYGLYHCAGAEGTSWFEFATAVVQIAGSRLSKIPEVVPIQTDDYPTIAQRPPNSRLDSTLLLHSFGLIPRSWRAVLPKMIAQLLSHEG